MDVHFDPAAFAQRQQDAYNERNPDQFLAEYTEDVVAYRLSGGEAMAVGRPALGEHYGKSRFSLPNLHAEQVNRMVSGNKVIDHERVSGVSEQPMEVVAIHEATPADIRRVWLLGAE